MTYLVEGGGEGKGGLGRVVSKVNSFFGEVIEKGARAGVQVASCLVMCCSVL